MPRLKRAPYVWSLNMCLQQLRLTPESLQPLYIRGKIRDHSSFTFYQHIFSIMAIPVHVEFEQKQTSAIWNESVTEWIWHIMHNDSQGRKFDLALVRIYNWSGIAVLTNLKLKQYNILTILSIVFYTFLHCCYTVYCRLQQEHFP